MSKSNPLGLLVNYGDSDEDSDDGSAVTKKSHSTASLPMINAENHASAAIHPPPISHCPWSACYDENSGFTYYWNQQTNAVTWEAPPEYLLALKLAQQQLNTSVSGEVSAEEWQLYQQALAEKQSKSKVSKSQTKSVKKNEKSSKEGRGKKNSKKRPPSDSEDDYKIELITSYYHSDSESNDEHDASKKKITTPKSVVPQPQQKKQKTKPVEFGPALPDNQSYTTPIGPDLPAEQAAEKPKTPEHKGIAIVKEEEAKSNPKSIKSDEDCQEESELLKKLKDKALLLEKLGGEIPTELQKIIKEDSLNGDSPKSARDLDIDELLQEIEKKEMPKVKSKPKVDISGDKVSAAGSPRSLTPGLEELELKSGPLFPSAANITETQDVDKPPENEKKKNIYLNEVPEVEKRPKLRISTSVLPRKEKVELPVYTTKYNQFIEGFSSERTGLGFNKEESEDSGKSCSNTISYGNGLMFTKGEVLNEDKKDEALDDMSDLVEAKLKYLMEVQAGTLAPMQEMMIQMQTLVSAFRAGALTAPYWRRWVEAAAAALAAHERGAAPPGWHCSFQRSEGRYCYRREADAFVQWEYPAVTSTDMDICTTPPPPDVKEDSPPTPPSASPPRLATPPPPAWHDPPPPGTDDGMATDPKKEIGDELMSFYNDIAELEKHSSGPNTASNSPEYKEKERDSDREKKEKQKPKEEKTEKLEKERSKKKSKVKISSSIGMKQKTLSSLVAKWQQVAEEISSD